MSPKHLRINVLLFVTQNFLFDLHAREHKKVANLVSERVGVMLGLDDGGRCQAF